MCWEKSSRLILPVESHFFACPLKKAKKEGGEEGEEEATIQQETQEEMVVRMLEVVVVEGFIVQLPITEGQVVLEQYTRYPWEGRVELTVLPERSFSWTLSVRIPAWAEQGTAVSLNGEPVEWESALRRGYLRIRRRWKRGDTLSLDFPLRARRVYAHPRVRMNAGRTALERGPLVYCFEEVDK